MTENQDIMKIDKNKIKSIKRLVHDFYESLGSITEAKTHTQKLKRQKVSR